MSTPAGYFEAMYRGAEDPWRLRDRWYEQRKYALTVASLPLPSYRRAFEPACSVGELTVRLADRCDSLLAADRVASAVRTTRARTQGVPGVRVAEMTVPEQWPEGTFDLVVLSELLYYFDEARQRALVDRACASLDHGGTLATVHWNHAVPDHRGTGADIADRLARREGLRLLTDHREPDFTLQIHARHAPGAPAPPTPAEREGLT
ncbi:MULTISPECIES: SAM-dependent methyltransferase [unclassified Streptomyces]|uniref:SAM-dependent methyltransferase n=1 Tax=unclassified Streptomyces TaxID=2593676 RepID=UPI000CD565E7|nr:MULTISPECIES: SAM-dependent methyltransferase [unclassified Streptomyces]